MSAIDPSHPPVERSSAYRAAIIANLAAVVCWAVAPILVKAISLSFPVNFQNAGRYLVSLAVLWPAYLLSTDRSRVRSDLAEVRRLAGKILLIALAQYAYQVSYAFSLTLIYPGLMTLTQQTSTIFGVALALAFFPDERLVVRDRVFIAGAGLAISGVLLVVLGGGSWGSAKFNVGVLTTLAGALSWAILSTMIRAWLPHVPPLLSISSVFTVLVPLFMASYAVVHRGFPIPSAPPIDWVVLIASGLIGVGLGQSLFYRALPVIGVATSSSLGLLLPFIASVMSWLAFGEKLSAIQIAGSLLIVAGSWLVIRRRLRPQG